jgi:hypothetical protein
MTQHRIVLALLLLGPLSACTALDGALGKAPDMYVEGLRPDLYWHVPLIRGTVQAVVAFKTAKPVRGQIPISVRVLTWNRLGDNVFDATLGETELKDPVDQGTHLTWGGPAEFPGGGAAAESLGIEIRVPYWFGGYTRTALRAEYCMAEVDGRGIDECGEWIDALLQLWVQCRGDIGQIVRCDGLNYVIAPAVEVLALGQRPPPMAEFRYITNGEVYFEHRADGWYYSQPPARGEEWGPSVGPFPEPESAAEEAARALDLRSGFHHIDGISEEWKRLTAALNESVASRR